jgi:hypothetical protein
MIVVFCNECTAWGKTADTQSVCVAKPNESRRANGDFGRPTSPLASVSESQEPLVLAELPLDAESPITVN